VTRTGTLSGQKILAIFAHPDDESLACGGTLARLADQGARVTLLCATRGEAGERTPGCSEDIALGTLRRGELHEAAQQLGLDDVILLDHPDGELNDVEDTLFRQEIVLTLRHMQPDLVITFAADGLYWHPDHIAVHERVTEAVESLGTTAPALFYVVFPEGLMRRVIEAAQANPSAPPNLSLWSLDPSAFGAYSQPATLIVDASSHVHRKLSALRCHRSQVGIQSPFLWLSRDDARRLLGPEYFVRAPVGSQDATCLDRLEPLSQAS
jgi:LmbE family N-acetylglucosaminyl deacetylase